MLASDTAGWDACRVGGFGFFKMLVILALIGGLAYFALDWARRDRQADFDRINPPPITVPQDNPFDQ